MNELSWIQQKVLLGKRKFNFYRIKINSNMQFNGYEYLFINKIVLMNELSWIQQ